MDEAESGLVEQAVGGDRAAIQRLLIRHHDRLVAMVEARIPADLQGALAADDVCQEAYVCVFQQIGSLRERDARAFRSWLQAILERKLIDVIRAARAQKRGGGRHPAIKTERPDISSVADLLDLVAIDERSPSQSAAQRELFGQVHAALTGLKEAYRDVLRWHYLEGLSVAETAERMGRSPGAVVMLCMRALEQLGQVIGDPARFLSRDA